MGGPCFMEIQKGKFVQAPPCTDNFQIKTFKFEGVQWQSVEQCYQAMKFQKNSNTWKKIHSMEKKPSENDSSHGMRAWQLGQSPNKNDQIPDFQNIKLEVMYRINLAKYAQNKDLQEELLSTENYHLKGGPSTWDWSLWNGVIQEQIRNIVRDVKNGQKYENQGKLIFAQPINLGTEEEITIQ